MPILIDFKPEIDLDRVLRNQGADPALVRQQSPRLVEIARLALDIGQPLLEPVVLYRELRVKRVLHERLDLEDGLKLNGKGITKHLAAARKVVVLLGTIGPRLEQMVSSLIPADPALGFALDSLGTTAVEALTVAACSHFGRQAREIGWEVTLPFSPGMDGWPADLGQEQIFNLIDPGEIGVEVTGGGMMSPQKSLTLVIGMGPEVDSRGRICDYCNLRDNCRYQDEYVD